ncbi:MAG: orotate phosphoribosyltransferase [Smithella sp.]|jgi:orotate phosphoribosyltransferase|nr:orotate phosphoribosyltransferase [Smithella sp.]
MTIDKMKERLGEIIIERSFKYSEDPPFTLASGKKSNYYFNCKPTTLDPEGMNLIGAIVFDMLKDTDITATGGLTLGADPIANALSVISYQKGKPIKSFIVRKDIKDHGTKSAIEGNVRSGEKVAIIDDVITTGASTITAIEQARKEGLKVELVITLIDREEGGKENILQHVDNIKSILSRTEVMNLRAKHINVRGIK